MASVTRLLKWLIWTANVTERYLTKSPSALNSSVNEINGRAARQN